MDARHQWLAGWPALMTIRPWMLGVGGHQSLLDREHQVVRSVERDGRDRWSVATEPSLQRVNCVLQ
jgi:hypothetical protein